MNVFSERLKKMLEIRNISQRKLSDETNIPTSVICRYVAGRYEPKYDNLISICKVLKCNPAYLRGETDSYDDFDGAELISFVKSMNPKLKTFTAEDYHKAYIFQQCEGLSVEQYEEIENYIEYVKNKKK